MRFCRSAEALALLLTLALAGCDAFRAQPAGSLQVRTAHLVSESGAAVLELGLDCRFSEPAQDALEHGIPITLRVDVRAGHWLNRLHEVRKIELRYFPLTRRYQLRELGGADTRSFSTPAYLTAALGALRIDLPSTFSALAPTTTLSVRARLDPSVLPGPLRLPALFEPAWRLVSPEYTWTLASH